jgi:hypothetical protein
MALNVIDLLKSSAGNAARSVIGATNPVLGAGITAGANIISGLKKKNTVPTLGGTPTYGPKPVTPVNTSPVQLPGASTPTLTPQNRSNPLSVAPLPAPKAPTTPAVPAGPAVPAPSTMDGYASSDPNVQAKIAAMQKQTTVPPASGSSYSSQASKSPEPTLPQKDTAPTVAPAVQGNSIIDALRTKIGSLSAPSEEETRLNDELAQFRGDSASSIAGLEGQGRGITAGLVRGQQEKELRQDSIKEQTLLDRITALSAKRQAQLAAAQNEYTIAAAEQSRQDMLSAPTSVGGSLIKFNPATGTYDTVYTAPQGAADRPATVQEYEYAKSSGYTGSFLDYQNAIKGTGSSEKPFSVSAGSQIYDPSTGTFISAPAVGQTPEGQAAAAAAAQQTVSQIDSLLASSGLSSAVGAKGISSLFGLAGAPLPGSPAATFNAQLDSFKAGLTFDKLMELKKSGAGLGVLSDSDIKLISSAAGALSSSMSESAFKAELNRIKETLAKTSAAGGQNSTQDDPLGLGFSKVGGDTNTAANTAIAGQLSAYVGKNAGQCGHFVNQMTGLKMGDSINSKLAFADKSIGTTSNPVQPGDVFIMPYKDTGHTGIVSDGPWIPKPDGTYDIPVVDSNYHLDGKVDTHYINSSKLIGFARAPLKSNFKYA